jgi:hypothetical protein
MAWWQAYLCCGAGVALSILIPVLSKSVRESFELGSPAGLGRGPRVLRMIWRAARPYLALSFLSLAVAAVIVAIAGEALRDPRTALVTGYLWDSTLQKVTGRP